VCVNEYITSSSFGGVFFCAAGLSIFISAACFYIWVPVYFWPERGSKSATTLTHCYKTAAGSLSRCFIFLFTHPYLWRLRYTSYSFLRWSLRQFSFACFSFSQSWFRVEYGRAYL